jgi:hypothetical protein
MLGRKRRTNKAKDVTTQDIDKLVSELVGDLDHIRAVVKNMSSLVDEYHGKGKPEDGH